MDLFPKFIIEDGALIIQKCTYHNQIVTDIDKVRGGGWFEYNHENNSFTFFGSSDEFGIVSVSDIINCIKNGEVYSGKYKHNNITNKYKFIHRNPNGEIIDLN